MNATDALIAVRGVHFAATVLAGGTVCFRVLVAQRAAARPNSAAERGGARLWRRLAWLTWAALGIAVLSGIAWLMLVTADILGVPIGKAFAPADWGAVLAGTRFGHVTCARLLIALALGLLLLWPRAGLLQLGAAALWVGLLAPAGHAGATPGSAGTIHLLSDVAHLLAAAAWLGGLPALVLVLAQACRGDDTDAGTRAAAVTARFSVLGVICVGTLLVSGLTNSLLQFDAPGQLITTDYGRLLLAKVALFAAMVAVAAINKFRVSPRLPSPAALRALLRNSLVETALGLCILFLVAALGIISPDAHVHSSSAEIPPEAAFVHLHSEQAMTDITVNPGCAGKTTATIRVMREDSSEFPAAFVNVALDPPAPGGPSIERRAEYGSDGTWRIIQFGIPASGIWTVRVIIGTQAQTSIVLDGPIVIAQCSNE